MGHMGQMRQINQPVFLLFPERTIVTPPTLFSNGSHSDMTHMTYMTSMTIMTLMLCDLQRSYPILPWQW